MENPITLNEARRDTAVPDSMHFAVQVGLIPYNTKAFKHQAC